MMALNTKHFLLGRQTQRRKEKASDKEKEKEIGLGGELTIYSVYIFSDKGMFWRITNLSAENRGLTFKLQPSTSEDLKNATPGCIPLNLYFDNSAQKVDFQNTEGKASLQQRLKDDLFWKRILKECNASLNRNDTCTCERRNSILLLKWYTCDQSVTVDRRAELPQMVVQEEKYTAHLQALYM